jgi:hypothetical protein
VILRVRATDASGNAATAQAVPAFGPRKGNEDEDD